MCTCDLCACEYMRVCENSVLWVCGCVKSVLVCVKFVCVRVFRVFGRVLSVCAKCVCA